MPKALPTPKKKQKKKNKKKNLCYLKYVINFSQQAAEIEKIYRYHIPTEDSVS